MFNNNIQFLDFREAVCKGVDVNLVKLGADFPGICLGFTNTGQDAKRDDSENWSKIPVQKMSVEAVERVDELRVVGDRQMAKKPDAAQEIAELNPEVANAASVYWGQVENICSDPVGFRRRLPAEAGVTCESGMAKAAEKSDNTLLIAAAAGACLVFYIYAA